jgi:phosphoribosylanthranilate isomerase
MNPLSFRVKICGITSSADATSAVAHGADALGVNFYSKSKRFVSIEAAAAISEARSNGVLVVGVFVSQSLDEILAATKLALLDWIQLHGDESPEFLSQVKNEASRPILCALRWDQNGATKVEEYLRECDSLGCLPDALLLDSYKAGEFGGTGHVADWEAIARWRAQTKWRIPMVLAGGLKPENVAAAIRAVRPDAVDTASGVECSPREKDPEMMWRFVAEARRAFAALV